MTLKLRFAFIILALALSVFLSAQEEKVDYIPKISGYVQGLYQLNEGVGTHTNTFKMQRVRATISGNICKKVTYLVQGDLVCSPMLMDAYVKYSVCPQFAIQAGQFKLPFTMETAMNPLDLEIFDYGESIKGLVGYSDVCGVGKSGRDMGIMISGDLFRLEDKDFSLLNYNIGIFNGNGPNVIDNNKEKDIVGRIKFHPWLKDLTITGSGYYGKYLNSSIEEKGLRMRYSFGAEYRNERFVFRSEYIGGKTGQEPYFNNQGYYAVTGYKFRFGREGKQQSLMPLLRYERFTKDLANECSAKSYYTIGLDYWPIKNVNFKLDYSLVQNISDDTNRHLLSFNRVSALLSFRF